MIFYLVRHGNPIYDPDSLTELGHKQATALSKRFALYGLDEIYSSTSTRAIQTAEPTATLLNKEINLLDWTNEKYAWQHFSVPNEKGERRWCFHLDDFKINTNRPDVLSLGQKWYAHPLFADSSFQQGIEKINSETDKFFLSLGFAHDREKGCYTVNGKTKERVALFAHEGIGKLFLSSVLDIPYPLIANNFFLGQCSVTVIYFDEKSQLVFPQILQSSNDSHLYKENILTGYNNHLNI